MGGAGWNGVAGVCAGGAWVPGGEAVGGVITLVRAGRVELPFPFGSQILSLVRLPVPPRSQELSELRIAGVLEEPLPHGHGSVRSMRCRAVTVRERFFTLGEQVG